VPSPVSSTARDVSRDKAAVMRSCFVWLLAIACGLAAASPAGAQQSGGRITADQNDIGRVETRIQKYDQALGAVSQLSRPSGAETECNGVCYFPSSSQPVSWRCAPKESCNLSCEVNPPVGGCR
jgi:hypothetical protein